MHPLHVFKTNSAQPEEEEMLYQENRGKSLLTFARDLYLVVDGSRLATVGEGLIVRCWDIRGVVMQDGAAHVHWDDNTV